MRPLARTRALTSVRRVLGALVATALFTATATACGADAGTPDASAGGSSTTSSSSRSSSSSPSEKSPSDSPSGTADAGQTLEVRVTGDDVAPVASQVDLSVGDQLTIEVTSDRAGELHVHSDPERSFDFGSGTRTFRLTLDTPGSVDVEEHVADVLVARVLVR